MSRYISMLDDDATEMQKALIFQGLFALFPSVGFDFNANAPPEMENSIIPLVGRPHPTDPDCAIVDDWPDEVVSQAVREAFRDLLEEVKSARVS